MASSSDKNNPKEIKLNPNWQYANFSKISTGSSFLYQTSKISKNHTIAINAGHGTKNGHTCKTLCHPDGSPKVTGGSTKKGEIYAYAVSSGMNFPDGTPEGNINFKLAQFVKEILIDNGYNVLMIRNDYDVQLDNIARCIIANNNADIHIALHFDSGRVNKGAFYLSVPDQIKNIIPVKNLWEMHNNLGKFIINGLRDVGIKIFGNGNMDIDLTQTNYSTIPSIVVEMGDQGSDTSDEQLKIMAEGLLKGIDMFFKDYK